MIEVRNITKRFGSTTAVDDLSFDAHPGRVTGFLGPNGSGKSTTMRCMLGLDHVDGGTASFSGRAYQAIDRPLFEVGSLLDAGYVHPGRTGRNHLRWMAMSNGITRRRVDESLELVGMTDVADRRVKGYSLGMKQRLGLAGVLLGDPETIVLDEPANGLDPEGIRWIRDILTYFARQGRTVLVSSHLLAEMALMADDLVVIGRGSLIEQCSVDEFVERHSTKWVRVASPQLDALVSAAGPLTGRVDRLDANRADLHGVSAEQIGELAARESIVLHELSMKVESLEDAFLRATAQAQEYSSAAVGTPPPPDVGMPPPPDASGAAAARPRGPGRRGGVMIDLLRSEILKFRTVRMHVWLPIGAIGLLLLVTALVGIFTDDPRFFDGSDLMSLIGGFSVIVAMIVGVVAALGVTSEFAHQTIRPTLAATPKRSHVFIAKAILSTAFGLATGIVAVVTSYIVGNVLLSGRDASITLSGDDGSLATFFGVPVLAALLALFGYGIGLVVRNSPAAVSLIILWPLLLESILAGVLSLAGVDAPEKLLPYTAAFALAIPNPLDAPAGGRIYGAVFFGLFALAITVVGVVLGNRRDV